MTYCLGVMLCDLTDLTRCYSIGSAWFQRLKLKYDKRVSNFAFIFNLRRYVTVLNATHLTFTRTPARPAAHLMGQAGG